MPILVQTSGGDPGMCFHGGATDLVAKPLNAEELAARCRARLANRAAVKRLREDAARTAAEMKQGLAAFRDALPKPAAVARAEEAFGLSIFARRPPGLSGDFWDAGECKGGLALWRIDTGPAMAGALAAMPFGVRAAKIIPEAASAGELAGKLEPGPHPFCCFVAGADGRFSFASSGGGRGAVWAPDGAAAELASGETGLLAAGSAAALHGFAGPLPDGKGGFGELPEAVGPSVWAGRFDSCAWGGATVRLGAPEAPETDAAALSPADLASFRVLVADDSRMGAMALAAALERIGPMEISLARDGAEALDLARGGGRFDLVVTDLMMPRLDGLGLIRSLRGMPELAGMPIVVQSGSCDRGDLAKAFAAGAADYLSKPLSLQLAECRLRVHVENSILLRRLAARRAKADAETRAGIEMQRAIMPQRSELEQMEAETGVRTAFTFRPSWSLGGDHFAAGIDGAGRHWCVLADFSGHGLGAAFRTFRLRALMDGFGLGHEPFDPAAFLGRANRLLSAMLPTGAYATMLAGVADPAADTWFFASAGHPAAMSRNPGSPALFGDSAGMPCGMWSGFEYENRTLPLKPGGTILLRTDGADEMPVPGNVDGILGTATLEAMLSALPASDPDSLIAVVEETLGRIGGMDDDFTLAAIKRLR